MKKSSIFIPAMTILFITTSMCAALPAMAIEHAAYHRALKDLRAARWLINNQPAGWKQIWPEEGAAKHIKNVIDELNKYNITDDKPLDDHSTIEDTGTRLARLQKALDLLRKVKNDIKLNEDNVFGANMKARIMVPIDLAINFTIEAINAKH